MSLGYDLKVLADKKRKKIFEECFNQCMLCMRTVANMGLFECAYVCRPEYRDMSSNIYNYILNKLLLIDITLNVSIKENMLYISWENCTDNLTNLIEHDDNFEISDIINNKDNNENDNNNGDNSSNDI